MSQKSDPFAVHDLPNGWTIEERHSVTSVYIGPDVLGNSECGRYTARFFRIPSRRVVQVLHFRGTTPKDQHKSLRAASAIARGKLAALPWSRGRMKNGRNWYYQVSLGDPINIAHEFERMTAGLDMTTDAQRVDAEFQRLTEGVLN